MAVTPSLSVPATERTDAGPRPRRATGPPIRARSCTRGRRGRRGPIADAIAARRADSLPTLREEARSATPAGEWLRLPA